MKQSSLLTGSSVINHIHIMILIGKICDSDYCVRGACEYNTTMIDGMTNYNQFCVCPSGYYGDRCQHVAFCDSNPCQNGGTCINKIGNAIENTGYYECRCSKQYYGRNCETGNKL